MIQPQSEVIRAILIMMKDEGAARPASRNARKRTETLGRGQRNGRTDLPYRPDVRLRHSESVVRNAVDCAGGHRLLVPTGSRSDKRRTVSLTALDVKNNGHVRRPETARNALPHPDADPRRVRLLHHHAGRVCVRVRLRLDRRLCPGGGSALG